jgi:hypothetical protein
VFNVLICFITIPPLLFAVFSITSFSITYHQRKFKKNFKTAGLCPATHQPLKRLDLNFITGKLSLSGGITLI